MPTGENLDIILHHTHWLLGHASHRDHRQSISFKLVVNEGGAGNYKLSPITTTFHAHKFAPWTTTTCWLEDAHHSEQQNFMHAKTSTALCQHVE